MSSSILQYCGGILESVALAAIDAVNLMDAESSLVGVVIWFLLLSQGVSLCSCCASLDH